MNSQHDRNTDPLIVILGKGPGCSSLHSSFYETGPIVVRAHGKYNFIVNNHSWNKAASVLYFDTPAGVGFS